MPDLGNRAKTLYRNGELLVLRAGFDPNHFAVAGNPNRPKQHPALNGHGETNAGLGRNFGGGLKQEATDTYILAGGLDFDGEVATPEFQRHGIGQIESAIFSLFQVGGRGEFGNFSHSAVMLAFAGHSP